MRERKEVELGIPLNCRLVAAAVDKTWTTRKERELKTRQTTTKNGGDW